jgi:hypothetical protein
MTAANCRVEFGFVPGRLLIGSPALGAGIAVAHGWDPADVSYSVPPCTT